MSAFGKIFVVRRGKKARKMRRLSQRLEKQPALEMLQARTLPSANPVSLNKLGQLVIQGTSKQDTVHVSMNSSQQVEVDYNGALSHFDPAKVKVVVFNGGGGNDVGDNSTRIRSVMRGGAGN